MEKKMISKSRKGSVMIRVSPESSKIIRWASSKYNVSQGLLIDWMAHQIKELPPIEIEGTAIIPAKQQYQEEPTNQ